MINCKLWLIKCRLFFFLSVSREKQKAEVKYRKVLEILQAKDNEIEILEQVSSTFK